MNKNELIKVYAYTQAIFGSFTMPKDKLQLESQNIVWLKVLAPYDLVVIYTAIEEYAKTNQFVNIAQIANLCRKIKQIQDGTYKSVDDYLNEISKAVSYSNAKENFEKLSDFAKEIVGNSARLAQWCNLGEDFYKFAVNRLYKEIAQKLEERELKEMEKVNKAVLLTSKAKKELKQ